MKVLIIAAMQEEVDAYLQAWPNLVGADFRSETIYTGKCGKAEVILARSGIGKVNAAVNTSLLLEKHKPDLVVNSGSAASIAEYLAIGDVVIADKLTYYDVDVTNFGYAKGQVPRMPNHYKSEARYNAQLMELTFDDFQTHQGLVCSGDSFIYSAKKAQLIKDEFPEALALDMESTAIAQTCYLFDTPCLIVRAITDHANQAATAANDDNMAWAMANSAKVLSAFLEKF